MKKITCCILAPEKVSPYSEYECIYNLFITLTEEFEHIEVLFSNQHNFNFYCLEILNEIRNKKPNVTITTTKYLSKYETSDYIKQENLKNFDNVLLTKHNSYSEVNFILQRDFQMIDNSDIVLF